MCGFPLLSTALPQLPPDWITHIESGVSHRLGGCHADGRPEICRALAAHVLSDGQIEVLLSADIGEHLLAAVDATRQVAYVAAQPGSNRTLHMKGRDATRFTPTVDYAAMFERNCERFLERVTPFGFKREVILAMWYDLPIERLMGVRFTPYGAWDQTPGPGAGHAVEWLP